MNTKTGIKNQGQSGFTLMEIVVATTIFALVSAAMLSLFNYTLKINRKSEALRQATQGMRNFAELLAKEVRNGHIDYYVQNDVVLPRISASSPCYLPTNKLGDDTYASQDNKIGVLTNDGYQECFYFADESGGALTNNVFSAPLDPSTGFPKAYKLMLEKTGGIKESLLPANYRVENFKVLIRPLCDPYSKCSDSDYQTGGVNDYPRIQPTVSIFIKFVAQLPTGEQVPIYYQTSISVNDYNIPSS